MPDADTILADFITRRDHVLRIGLFLGTNIAILVLFSIIFKVLGLEQYLAAQGVQGNLTGLLIMCGIFGFAGSILFHCLSQSGWQSGPPACN